MIIIKLSQENFTCPMEQIMLKELSLVLPVVKLFIKSFEKGMEIDIYSLKSVYIQIS